MICALALAAVALLAVIWSFGGDVDYLSNHGADLGQAMERGAWVIL